MKQNKLFIKSEILLITFMWLVMIIAPILFRSSNETITWEMALQPLQTLIPLFILFLFNRLFLVPKLLFKKKTSKYFISVISLIAIFTLALIVFEAPNKRMKRPPFEMRDGRRIPPPESQTGSNTRRMPPPHIQNNRPNQPLPAGLNFFIFSILIIGFDTGLRASFEWANSEKEKEELEKESTTHLLNMLRHQVSPHFFMNTLNNIHTLIDIDAEDAKDSVMKLSKMMRYLLYETANDKTTLAKEIEFIESYIELMKLRVSEKVDIQVNLPENPPIKSLPPLLFTSFIENAFKHGVSYQKDSFIHISLLADDKRLALQIKNSKGSKTETDEASGIGLENVKKRLALIYGEDYNLDIFDTTEDYSIHLSIPLTND